MNPVCYKIEIPVNDDHWSVLSAEIVRQVDLAERFKLPEISEFYKEKFYFYYNHCYRLNPFEE